MKVFIQLICMFYLTSIYSQSTLNMSLLSHIEFGEDGNDIWGFVDAHGTEYAVMGTQTATRIYSLEDPSNPIERYVATGASSIWRDIKYFNNHLYVTADQGSDGLVIIDVSGAPDNFSHTFWQPTLTVEGTTTTLRTTHNLYIDENGFAYLAGSNIAKKGVIILDLNQDPKNPVMVGAANKYYSHDAYVKDNLLYSSELEHGFAIYDVTDKANVIELARQNTSFNFCHNSWLSADGNYLYTTDEKGNAFMDVYDISDKANITLKDKFQPLATTGKGVIPHNTHTLNNFAVTSWYTDGIVITDMSRPENVVMVGQYDTYLGPDGNFNGDWGAYPFLPSGIMLASDINSGLYVLGADLKRACYLEGKAEAKDENGIFSPISGATITILSPQLGKDQTNNSGNFKTGIATPGQYQVVFSHPNYANDTATVTLVSGEVTELNFLFETLSLSGRVNDANTGQAISGAKILLKDLSNNSTTETATDANGQFSVAARSGANYDVYATAWGYKYAFRQGINTDSDLISFSLERGYEDDFITDLGWTTEATSPTGQWVRVAPKGTVNGGQIVNPNSDASGDVGDAAYVTGNSGVGVGDDDVDDGTVTLTSPTFDMDNSDTLLISYQYWFYNGGGNTTPNDTLLIYLSNGQKNILIQKTTASESVWRQQNLTISKAQIDMTSNMSIKIVAGDYLDGHLVEAGFDNLKLSPAYIISKQQDLNLVDVSVTPNVTSGSLNISSPNEIINIDVLNEEGKIMKQVKKSINGYIDISKLHAGVYFVKINTVKGSRIEKVVKI